ncbi:MAG: hypothetical protein P8M34_14815 [Saprospiraceae bacterium]|nr:hypothetical protein [Saprospiraceae bacterium]|tara:strand:+ start:2749 stop:4077 length:1329 start_codon:yes stop_codon:yes gene_type:complete
MFESFPHTCQKYGVKADVRSLLLLRKSMDKGLVNTVGDIYKVMKGVIVKEPTGLGPFTRAYYDYFLGIIIAPGEPLNNAVARSDAFGRWKSKYKDDEEFEALEIEEKINKFLDEVHETTYDIKKVIDGKDILAKDDPTQKDEGQDSDEQSGRRHLDRAADYQDIDLEELRRRMEEVMKQQEGMHEGGSHWIGQGGISPYGNNGAAKGGIRVGGSGGGKMARAVIGDPKFYPVDIDSTLSDNNVDAALASLKGIKEEDIIQELDIPITIKKGLKRGGLFLPIQKEKITDKLQVLLMIDNGGWSMDPYVRAVTSLFRKMKTRFAHDLELRYFHNTVYDVIYTDDRRTKYENTDKVLDLDPNYRVFVVGDAAMAPYELDERSVIFWGRLKEKFKRTAWLNPTQEKYWNMSYTTQMLKQIIDMYPMSPRGIEKAVQEMNRKTFKGK